MAVGWHATMSAFVVVGWGWAGHNDGVGVWMSRMNGVFAFGRFWCRLICESHSPILRGHFNQALMCKRTAIEVLIVSNSTTCVIFPKLILQSGIDLFPESSLSLAPPCCTVACLCLFNPLA